MSQTLTIKHHVRITPRADHDIVNHILKTKIMQFGRGTMCNVLVMTERIVKDVLQLTDLSGSDDSDCHGDAIIGSSLPCAISCHNSIQV
ncbi:hypothetical protein I4U23_003137 [Adineta vaga]|nr:hypothetical protein I4U23_003137 [Adineta vaga]